MDDNNQYLMSEEEIKNAKRSAFFERIKYYWNSIEPAVAKILNGIIYYSIRFIKAFVTSLIRAIMGKEV